jgi:integrase
MGVTNIARRYEGGPWRARYRDDARVEHTKQFKRKVDAQAWLDDITTAVKTGQYVDPKAGKVTIKEFAGSWEAAQIGEPNTLALMDNTLRLHVLPVLGNKTMSSVRQGDIQSLIKALSEKYAPGTVRNHHDVLFRMFAAAVMDKVIPVSPCKNINLPSMATKEVIPPTIEEVTALIGAMPDLYRAAAILLAGSGLRIGELLGLRVKLDQKAGDIHVMFKTVRIERQRLQSCLIGPPKGKRARNVPVGLVVIEALKEHMGAYPSTPYLFTNDAGDPLTYQTWAKVWRKARKEAGVPDMVTHDLRHFFASTLLSQGASIKQVQLVLGHASPVITLRTYAHLMPGDEDRTRSIMDTMLNKLRPSSDPGPTQISVLPGQTG